MEYHPYGNYINTENTWLTKIPSHWKLTTFNRMLKGIKDGTHGTHSRVSDGCPLLSAKNVHDRYLDISDTESTISEEEHKSIVSNGYPAKNDVLVTCVGTIGRSFVYDRDEPLSFQRSVAFLRLEEAVFPQYCKYFIESKGYQDYLLSVAKISAQSGVYMGDISKSPILDVPFEEQQKIAAFLDYKTQQIDQLIEKKKALIEKLEEKRIAVITQAVTKGLDKNVTLKSSDVDWLGHVPEHWLYSPLRWLGKRYAGGTPDKSKDEYWVGGTIPWLNSGAVNQGDINTPSAFITEEAYNSSSTKWVPEGAIVLALAGQGKTKGTAAYMKINATCNQSMAAIVFDDKYYSRFMYWWLVSQYKNIRGMASDDGRDGLNLEMIGSIPCPIPTLDEQMEIAHYIDEFEQKRKKILEKLNSAVEKLDEYQSAIITSAVTGKIDVRNVGISKEAA